MVKKAMRESALNDDCVAGADQPLRCWRRRSRCLAVGGKSGHEDLGDQQQERQARPPVPLEKSIR